MAPSPQQSGPATGAEMNRLGQRLQELIEEAGALSDPMARSLVQECMETVIAFYGHGLERILRLVGNDDKADSGIQDRLLNDSLLRGLWLIHGLHPEDLSTRLHQALNKVRPYMESHGGNVELISLEGDFARLRLQGSCEGCPSSAVTMQLAVRQAIEEACPDLAGFEVEGATDVSPATPLQGGSVDWLLIEGVENLIEGALISVHPAGVPIVLCKVGGRIYAYGDRCPACNLPLHLGTLSGEVLSCRSGHCYDVRLAGLNVEYPQLHLDPFPLIMEDGQVRVALRAEEPIEL